MSLNENTPQVAENVGDNNEPARSARSTRQEIAERAATIRRHIILGRGRKEICAIEGLTVSEYRVALRYIGREWATNREAFGNFRMGIAGHLEDIERRMKALLEFAGNEIDKVHAYVKLKKLWIETEQSQYEMALKLGILQRESFKIEDRREVSVSFGDENAIPFFAQRPQETVAKTKVN